MITLYYARSSLYSRFVWPALLEKKLAFELVPVLLDGRQFEPEFRAINPFSQIPILIDDGFRILESGAILDYLEAKYPEPALLPTDAVTLAKVRMVQEIATNKLVPATAKLIIERDEPSELEYARLQTINVLDFLTDLLRQEPYFGGEQLTIADIVAGILVPDLPRIGIALNNYPQLTQWCDRLLSRDTWQQIWFSDEEFSEYRRRFRILPKIWQKRRRHSIKTLASNCEG